MHLVRKRDGSLVEFDESRIADAIYKAALSVGGADRFLAEELAGVVSLFLEKGFGGDVAGIEEIQDLVEKVLIETGHAKTAKAYILYRERRTKLREAERRPARAGQGTLFTPPPVRVLDAGGERAGPLSREVLARTLAAEADVAYETAASVARAVEERVRELDLEAVSGTLLFRLVDAELLSRGMVSAVAERGGVDLSRHRVASALFPKEWRRRGTPVERVGGDILVQHTLEEVYPDDVTDAHLSGRLHLWGLGHPTGLFAASVSPEAIRAFGIPGLPGKYRPASVGTPRRIAAHLGRAVRRIVPHVSHGVALSWLNVFLAPLMDGMDLASLREEAWHLLSELAEIPFVEIELGLAPPPILGARRTTGGDGEPRAEDYSHFTTTARLLAVALLEVRGTGSGLGPRSELPKLTMMLGRESLEDEESLKIVARAVREGLDREPLLFVLDRGELPLVGTSRSRIRLEDAARITDPATMSQAVGTRVAISLPRAAFRSGSANPAGFLEEVERSTELALAGIRARARFHSRCATGPDGPLSFLARGRGGAPGLLDLERVVQSVSVTGLNEAVAHVTGEELHEADEAVKIARRALGVIGMRCREVAKEAISVEVDEEEDPRIAARFADHDRAEFPDLLERIPDSYTPGVGLRRDAPVDMALRLEIEGRLGAALRTTTVNLLIAEGEHPSPESVVALLRKTWKNTRVRQVLLGRRG